MTAPRALAVGAVLAAVAGIVVAGGALGPGARAGDPAASGAPAASAGSPATPTGDADPSAGTGGPASGAPAVTTPTGTVRRQSMATTADLDASLGYEGSRSIPAGAAGTLTRLREPGTLVRRGGWLYELDGRVRPRVLYGDRPLWRPMGPGMSDGADVLQLERNLKAMGFAPRRLKVDRHWDARTTAAVKRWQAATGRTRDGTLDGSDVVFLPGAVRIASNEAALGAAVGPGAAVLTVTSSRRVVTLALAATRQDLLAAGQAVTVELPSGAVVPAKVRGVGRVATGDGQGATTVAVTIDLDPGAALPALDAAPVTVHVETTRHDGVLTVPVNALIALLEGGYAVEVVGDGGAHRYVRVETGLFQDGRVEVRGDGLADGATVVTAR